MLKDKEKLTPEAKRKRLQRQREREERSVYQIECPDGIEDLLIRTGRLDPNIAHQPKAVRLALEKLIRELIEVDLRHA